MKQYTTKKRLFVLSSIIVILLLINIILAIFILPQRQLLLEQKEQELDILTNNFNQRELEHMEKLTELNNLQTGNYLELHDPFYNEAINFKENNTSISANIFIDNSKNIGINCALVEIIMGDELIMFESIAFNTIDKGLVYFDTFNGYSIHPEIGKNLTECIEEGHNYDFDYFNDTIREILIIW